MPFLPWYVSVALWELRFFWIDGDTHSLGKINIYDFIKKRIVRQNNIILWTLSSSAFFVLEGVQCGANSFLKMFFIHDAYDLSRFMTFVFVCSNSVTSIVSSSWSEEHRMVRGWTLGRGPVLYVH